MLALYARMTARETQGFLAEMYAVEVSPDLISTVTDGIAVTDGLKGMSEALAAVFPATTLQTCIVHFPNDDAATKLTWLSLRNIMAKWELTAYYWRPAMNPFAILYEDRFSPSTA